MTILLEETLRFLAGMAAWLSVMAALSAVAAYAVAGVRRQRPSPSLVIASAAGALVVAALAHRLGLPGTGGELIDRPLPFLWALAGALGAGEVSWRWLRLAGG